MSGKKNNMELWEKVCMTDPAITKHIKQRGGFTAICAQAQLKEATKLWGPYGGKWGLRGFTWGLIGSVEVTEEPKLTVTPAEMTLDAVFWYPGGEFEMSSDIKYKAGDDCRKKLITDVRSKALSCLGFNSDVFEGSFDSQKYVEKVKQIFSAPAVDVQQLRHKIFGITGNDGMFQETCLVLHNMLFEKGYGWFMRIEDDLYHVSDMPIASQQALWGWFDKYGKALKEKVMKALNNKGEKEDEQDNSNG